MEFNETYEDTLSTVSTAVILVQKRFERNIFIIFIDFLINSIHFQTKTITTAKDLEVFLHHFQGNAALLKEMIEAGRATNFHDNRGWKPLHHAAHRGSKECLDLLIRAGKCYCLKLGCQIEQDVHI
jgi:ankyrin repeat protein